LKVLRADAPRDEGRHQLSAVLAEMRPSLAGLLATLQSLREGVSQFSDASLEIDKLHEQLCVAIDKLAHLSGEDSWDGLRWLEVNPRSIRLHLTPLDVADTLKGLMSNGEQAWIFTSATLAIGEDFSHFTERMGLTAVTGMTFPSPYALDKHGLIWLPQGLPPPSDPGHTAEMLERVVPLLKLTGGGMFCLFTSHRALNAAQKWFKSRKKRLNGRPLIIQGDAPRDDLLRRFREHGNAVLLGTGSFWEGVDVRGPALSIVAIDKLPFASPADPLLMARLEFIRRQGGNGFTEHQLPQAALALKQGAGRLLRDQNDFGVVVLCDPRISGKLYGRVFLKCLEPMQATESEQDVAAFFKAHEADQGTAGNGRRIA
jgi:ATP-dependent DNA helicase DinG